jgi:glycosyltransferase involved in cell wall biosynthesis
MLLVKRKKIHIKVQPDGWILQRMADELRVLDNITISETIDTSAYANYFINYFQYEPVSTHKIAWFTHLEEFVEETKIFFFQTIPKIDYLVCQANLYSDLIKEFSPNSNVRTISPGFSQQEYRLKPIRIGIVGRTYPSGRKGEDILERLGPLPGIEFVATGSGWPIANVKFLSDHEMPDFYQSIDYLLITSHYEGGPMAAIEALASGVPVISPEVGWIPELPHIPYVTADAESLRAVLDSLVSERQSLRKAVEHRTWDNWRIQHQMLFDEVLSKR